MKGPCWEYGQNLKGPLSRIPTVYEINKISYQIMSRYFVYLALVFPLLRVNATLPYQDPFLGAAGQSPKYKE